MCISVYFGLQMGNWLAEQTWKDYISAVNLAL